MHIAIDVNDPSVAQKILHYLKSFKNEIAVDAFENDEEFEKNKQSLHTIYNSIKNSPENLHALDNDFWDEMDSAIKNA